MPTKIEDGRFEDELKIILICEGCGEEIDSFYVTDDQREKYEDERPIHDSVTCKNKATTEEVS